MNALPNIAIAVSGGGLRALLGSAGILNGLDLRNPQAKQAGTGGILQLGMREKKMGNIYI